VIRRPALVGAFAARLMLLPLGQRFIVTGDEARFANLAQDMLARGTWFDAQRYRNKPLLYPWAIKIFSMPGGRVTEATSQLPIVLPLPVVIIWLLTDAGVRGLRRLGSALGLLAFIVVTAAWLVPFLFAGSRSFARTVVWEDWLAWYLGGPRPLKNCRTLLRRPRVLVPGVAVGMAVLLTGGVMFHNTWVNRGQNYPALAALVDRHADGGEVGIIGGRFFSIDFYLRRALTQVRTVADTWTGRPERPVVVVTDRAWNLMRGQVRPDVEVLDALRIRTHTMLIVRRAAPPR
jgi:hypothetical protein